MKKFLLCIFSFLFIGTALAGSAFLLAGCDYSYSQEGDNQMPNNGENNDSGENNEQEDNVNDDNEDGEVETGAQTDHNFTVYCQIRTSGTSSGFTTTSSNTTSPAQLLEVMWHNAPNTIIAWDKTPTINSGGELSAGIVYRCSYFYYKHYSFFGQHRRFVEIFVYENGTGGDYIYCGYSTSNTFDNGSYKSYNSNVSVFLNGNGGWSTTEPSGTIYYNAKGTVYMKFRRQYKHNYYIWRYGSPGTYNSYSSLTKNRVAGVATTYAGRLDSNIEGYTQIGWATSKNVSTPTYSLGASMSSSSWNSNVSFYAVYAPEIKIYAYYTSDYSNFYNSNTGGTIGGTYINTSGSTHSFSLIYHNSFYARYNSTVKLTSTSKSGYIFRGWFDSTSASTLQGSPLSSSSSYTFYPTTGAPYTRVALFVRYKLITMYNRYTTTYDTISKGTTGGSIKVSYTNTSNSASSYTLSETSTAYSFASVYSKTVTLTATANSGYQFVGWYSSSPSTSSESTYRITTAATYSFTASARSSIYGLFAKTYTLTIKYASGNYTSGHSTTITATNSTIGLSQTISTGNSSTFSTYCRPNSQTITIARVNGSYTYYMGNGSATTSSSTNSFTYSWSTTADATINVYVRERYRITYNGNGNTGGSVPSAVYKAHGLNVTLASNNLTRTGYTANGWNANSAGTGTHYNNGASYSGNGNATLYAQWTANTYYVKFNGNGSTSGSMSNQTFTYDKAQNLTANAFAKTGYSFAGWATSASGSVVYADKASVKNLTSTNGATVNLYAKWNTVSYTITYNGNGGNSPSKLTYNIESTSTLSSSSRTGYTFNGWKPSASSGNWSSGTTYASGTSVKGKYGNVTLVAQWTAKQYTLTLKGNGGTPDTQVMSPKLVFDSGNWNDVAGNRPTKAGFTFTGFYTSATGGEQVYDSNGQCVNGTYWQDKKYKYEGDLTVYAHWQANLEAKKDEAGGYYYVEIGNMPQTRVTDSSLISQLNSSTTNGATYYINGTTMVSKKVNNVEYCKYGNNWYKVEPIRWRLAYSSSQTSGYGTTTDTFAVLDTIVYAGQYASGRLGGGQGYVTTTLDEFKKNITSTTYLAAFSANVESYTGTGITSSSQSANMFISSADEISSVLNNKTGSAKYSVKFSDLVKDILGKGIHKYYTRNLGSNTSTIKSYTELGMLTQNLCTNIQGVQFTIKVSEYGCV